MGIADGMVYLPLEGSKTYRGGRDRAIVSHARAQAHGVASFLAEASAQDIVTDVMVFWRRFHVGCKAH